jgi:acid phosphatase
MISLEEASLLKCPFDRNSCRPIGGDKMTRGTDVKLTRQLLRILVLGIACVPLVSLWPVASLYAQHNPSSANVLLPPEHVPNLGRVKQLLKAYHDCTCKCGCYTAELNQQERRAMAFLEKRARARKPGEKLALVLDIDETALSNYSFYEATDMGRIQKLFYPWIDTAQAPAIGGTLQLSQKARALQVDVFFISGRREPQRPATEKNLEAQGYADWSGLMLRPVNDTNDSVAVFKSSARQRIVDQGYHIILNVGDQLSDLSGEPAAELSVKLPNPFYFIP